MVLFFFCCMLSLLEAATQSLQSASLACKWAQKKNSFEPQMTTKSLAHSLWYFGHLLLLQLISAVNESFHSQSFPDLLKNLNKNGPSLAKSQILFYWKINEANFQENKFQSLLKLITIPSAGVKSNRFGSNLSGTEVLLRSSSNLKWLSILANAIFTSITANLKVKKKDKVCENLKKVFFRLITSIQCKFSDLHRMAWTRKDDALKLPPGQSDQDRKVQV